MNWAKENKFLTGYGIVMLIGVGFLGFKVFSASSAYDDASARYSAKAASYSSLRHTAPDPNRENLAAFEAQKKEAAEVTTNFQRDLAKREFPMEPTSPSQFQDALKKAVTEIKARAATANVILPKDKFYLGFNRYEGAPPDKDAATPLHRDLKAIEWIVAQLLTTPVMEVKDIKRPEIAEEKTKPGTTTRPATPRPGAAAQTRPDLLSVHTFDVTFTCKQHQLDRLLNTIVSPDAPQFYIIRNIRIANSITKAPARQAEVPPAEPAIVAVTPAPVAFAKPVATPVAAVPAATPAATVTLLVGDESLDVTLHLEIVDFAEPAAPAGTAVK